MHTETVWKRNIQCCVCVCVTYIHIFILEHIFLTDAPNWNTKFSLRFCKCLKELSYIFKGFFSVCLNPRPLFGKFLFFDLMSFILLERSIVVCYSKIAILSMRHYCQCGGVGAEDTRVFISILILVKIPPLSRKHKKTPEQNSMKTSNNEILKIAILGLRFRPRGLPLPLALASISWRWRPIIRKSIITTVKNSRPQNRVKFEPSGFLPITTAIFWEIDFLVVDILELKYRLKYPPLSPSLCKVDKADVKGELFNYRWISRTPFGVHTAIFKHFSHTDFMNCVLVQILWLHILMLCDVLR